MKQQMEFEGGQVWISCKMDVCLLDVWRYDVSFSYKNSILDDIDGGYSSWKSDIAKAKQQWIWHSESPSKIQPMFLVLRRPPEDS